MRGRSTLTDIKVDETLAALLAWLLANGGAGAEDNAHAAASAHWDRHVLPDHPNPCFSNPCKSAAISAVILELLLYGRVDDSLELLDALATTTDETAARLARLPVGYRKALEPLQGELKRHLRRDDDGRYRHRPFRDGRVLFELQELVAEGKSLLSGLRAAAVREGTALRAFAAKLRELSLWPDDHGTRTKAVDRLLISATQHLHAAGFDAAETARLIIDEGDRHDRPHARHLKAKKRSLPVDRVRQRLTDYRAEDLRILEIPFPEGSPSEDLSGRQPKKRSS
jgi:hypothetical protein